MAYDGNLRVAPEEPLSGNDIWAGAVALCWDALLNKYNGGAPSWAQSPLAHLLDRRTLGLGEVRKDHYYVYIGDESEGKREHIEDAVRERFGLRAPLLDMLSWDGNTMLAYTMLVRSFSFRAPFSPLDRRVFGSAEAGNTCDDAEYFGIGRCLDAQSRDRQLEQVRVCFYEDPGHFAVTLTTSDDDLLTFARGLRGASTWEMWEDLIARRKAYAGLEDISLRCLRADEPFAIPRISAGRACLYPGLSGSIVGRYAEGESLVLGEITQTVSASIAVQTGRPAGDDGTCEPSDGREPRSFIVDDDFVMFLSDGDMSRGSWLPFPCLALHVHDLPLFMLDVR